MKTENSSTQVTRGPRQGRWIGFTIAILAVVGLSYGALRFWSKSDQAALANASVAGESVVIPVEGMSCSACVARVKKTLKRTEGVSEAHVNLEKGEAEIRYEPAKISPGKLAKAIDDLGYKAGPPRPKEKDQ